MNTLSVWNTHPLIDRLTQDKEWDCRSMANNHAKTTITLMTDHIQCWIYHYVFILLSLLKDIEVQGWFKLLKGIQSHWSPVTQRCLSGQRKPANLAPLGPKRVSQRDV